MGQIMLQINRWSQYIHAYKAPTIIMLMIKVTRTIYTQAYKKSFHVSYSQRVGYS